MLNVLPLLLVALLGVDEPPAGTGDAPPRKPDRVLEGGIIVELLTAPEAREAIVDPTDRFFAMLTPLEISLRLDEDVRTLPREEQLEKFRTFLRGEVTDWTEEERDTLLAALPKVAEACRKACPDILPERWRFIRTTGREESGAPYTRGDCIILPAGTVEQYAKQSLENLGKLVVHETVHVFTRTHPERRDSLYGAFGFRPIPEVALPESVESIRLTNPDAPGWGYAIDVRDKDTGEEVPATLLLTSSTPKFQKAIRGVLPVLQFHLYPLTGGDEPALRLTEEGEPVRWMPFITPGFLDTVGRNTGYIIHPEEILADNVSILTYPPPKVPNPELLVKVAKLLGGTAPKTAGAGEGTDGSSR